MLDEAIENYRQVIIIRPNDAEGYSNLSGALKDKCLLDEAVEKCQKALQLDPSNAEIHNNLGMLYLLSKDFDRGWNAYEWRLKTIKVAPLRKPKWDGSSLKGKTILVYAEQGYGDTLQFARYLPGLYEDFGAERVLFMPPKVLAQLLMESNLKADILDAETSVESLEYDTNIHLMSLPGIFKTNLENIPFRQKRYLKANPEKVEWYRKKFFDPTPYTLHPTPYTLPPIPYTLPPTPYPLHPSTSASYGRGAVCLNIQFTSPCR